MVCRIGWLLKEPVIQEVTEKSCSEYNSRTGKWDRWIEPMLVPEFHVHVYYDYHGCCGRDNYTFIRATREDAEALVETIRSNNFDWLRYDPEELAAYQEELDEE